MSRLRVFCLIAFLLSTAARTYAVTPTPAELADADRFIAAKFLSQPTTASTLPGIAVLSNHGPVQPNARGGEPLRIGSATYTTGLYCHAPSNLTIHLPRPGKSFHSLVGIDARAGGGSTIAIVRLAGQELYRSPTLHLDTPPQSVNVDLHGATEFTLEITDAGDGISCDQTNWAEATVTLDDGSQWRLGDQPIVDAALPPYSADPPFSFIYAGKSSASFLPHWKAARSTTNAPNSRLHTLTYTDPATGLSVGCDCVQWLDYPALEWTLHFKNTGKSDTPILEAIHPLDTLLPASPTDNPILHHNTGDLCTAESYAPHADPMPIGYHHPFIATAGRPTQFVFPYFNLATSPTAGTIFAVSWPGQWAADLSRDSTGSLHLLAGQELTHFLLHPGEEVRSPRIIVSFYRGDWLRGQNLWRRWVVAHNMPHPADNQPVAPGAWLCTGNFYPGLMSNAKQELSFLKTFLDAGIQFDAWWQDAGWYPCDTVTWPKTGTWEVDPVRFPKGLREVSDYVHSRGLKSIVWFEPERVYKNTWLAQNHPDWIHGGKAGGLLDLGNPAARTWLTDHIDQFLTDQSIDVYRQDFNIDPLSYWRAADAPDRQGITEIRHIEGYLAYWDELLHRHPGLWIDSCSSGGRRDDPDTLRRAVPLLRSDWYWSPDGQQCQTYGLSLWFPYQGTGAVGPHDEYWYRSSMVAGFTIGPDGSGVASMDLPLIKRMVDEHRQMSDAFLADYYPLTSYSQANDVWLAWQYDRPEIGFGVVQAFRRDHCVYESARLPLRGLNPAAIYLVTHLDTGQTTQFLGRDLLDKGLPIAIPSRPGSAIVTYRLATPNGTPVAP